MERRWFIRGTVTIKSLFRACYEAALAAAQEGQELELLLRPAKSKRSQEQNRRYWALLREVASVVWIDGRRYSDEVWHEQFKRWFIGMEEVVMPDKQVEQRGMSTTTLTVSEFNAYMAEIETWCAEQGFPVMQEVA